MWKVKTPIFEIVVVDALRAGAAVAREPKKWRRERAGRARRRTVGGARPVARRPARSRGLACGSFLGFSFIFLGKMGHGAGEMEERWRREAGEARRRRQKERNEREFFHFGTSIFCFWCLFFTLVLSFFVFGIFLSLWFSCFLFLDLFFHTGTFGFCFACCGIFFVCLILFFCLIYILFA